MNFYRNQKRREVIGCLNRLSKNDFNYFIVSLPVIICTIIMYIYNILKLIMMIKDSKISFYFS